MNLFDLATRVKRGAKLLDRKIPNWRQVLRKHVDQYDFIDGDHCVLGTLGHYSGRMRVLANKQRYNPDDTTFGRAARALGIFGRAKNQVSLYGFDERNGLVSTDGPDSHRDRLLALGDLWRAEFEK